MKKRKAYSMQDIARILGTTRRTMYNWEKAGKVPKPKRDPMSNYRVYSEEDLRKLKKITER